MYIWHEQTWKMRDRSNHLLRVTMYVWHEQPLIRVTSARIAMGKFIARCSTLVHRNTVATVVACAGRTFARPSTSTITRVDGS